VSKREKGLQIRNFFFFAFSAEPQNFFQIEERKKKKQKKIRCLIKKKKIFDRCSLIQTKKILNFIPTQSREKKNDISPDFIIHLSANVGACNTCENTIVLSLLA
jgi:hypothetical protein